MKEIFKLYPKTNSTELDTELFKNPSKEYRGAPFWSWNCKLDKEILKEQIGYFKQMGFGGFHIHSRVGLDTEYLGSEFMDCVKHCTDLAEKSDMLAWLYDEDKAPSGSAGGLATKKAQNRMRKLFFTENPLDGSDINSAITKGQPYLIACYDIMLNENGALSSFRKISPKENAIGKKRYAYLVTEQPSVWYNNQTYLDTLSENAVDDFIEITYDEYKKAVGDKFSSVVPAMFTDEPAFCTCISLKTANGNDNAVLAWTTDFDKLFKKQKGYDIIERLPELFWDNADGTLSKARYDYYDFCANLLCMSYFENISKWCENNNIMFTGHLKSEHSLYEQSIWCGEIMRAYKYFSLPGMDILLDKIEFSTAKQCQSAVHQYGREGMASEMYGVTNWDFDFRDHKFQGDWQAALGVTLRVHHLSMLSMSGEAKRDFPASINYQSPWYKKYSYIENHYARLATVLTRGKPIVKIGVIHPIESMWLLLGCDETSKMQRDEFEHNFEKLNTTLLQSLIDFDFISEALLPSLYKEEKDGFTVGQMSYQTIIVPKVLTLRSTTLKALESFNAKGGRIIFLDDMPNYIDGAVSDEAKSLYDKCEKISLDELISKHYLNDERIIDIIDNQGKRTNNYIYNLRQDNDVKWLFIANSVKPQTDNYTQAANISIIIKGHYEPCVYDTLSGKIYPCEYEFRGENTVIPYSLYCHDSLLLQLKATEKTSYKDEGKTDNFKVIEFSDFTAITRCEENVLLLDKAEFSFDGEAFQAEEEILRIDDKVRVLSGLKSKELATFVQPWLIPDEKPKHFVTLRFTINSDKPIHNTCLALEDAEFSTVKLNGNDVPVDICGYYVDRCIKKMPLGTVQQGKNTLEITLPVHSKSNIESCYLLGEFDVELSKSGHLLKEKRTVYTYDSITEQGMPFYSGNLEYETSFETEFTRNIEISVDNYRGAVIGVNIDGKELGLIAFSPYSIKCPDIKSGKHILKLTLYGNRYNTFGPLHNAAKSKFASPYSWRKRGDDFSYDYVNLHPFGILSAPLVKISK